MTSNFPGTVDIHGSETDKHAELRAEDERPARTVKPEESAGQAIASHIQPPQGKTQRRCALSRQEDGSTGHFPQPKRNCGMPYRPAYFKKQYLRCHNGIPCFYTLQKALPRTSSQSSESASVSEASPCQEVNKS